VVSAIHAVSTVSRVDFLIILLLLLGPLAVRLQESSLGLRSLNAYVSDCEQIDHCFGFFEAISSTVLISLTPSQKALMILMSWMYGTA
jgi:hypothetical protein